MEGGRRDSLNFSLRNLKLNLVINDIILIYRFGEKYQEGAEAWEGGVKGNWKGIWGEWWEMWDSQGLFLGGKL